MYLQLLSQFENYLIFQKQLSKNTIIHYIGDLRQFISFMGKKEPSKELVTDFKKHLLENKNCPRTISRKITSLREFFKFSQKDIDIISPKLQFKLPDYFPKNQIISIIDFMKQNNSYLGLRNQLIFNFTYATGIRVSELINISLDHLNYDMNFVLINGKGNKQRFVPIPKSLQHELQNYIENIRPQLNKHKSNYLFFSEKTKKFTRQNIWFIFNKIGKQLNIKLYPHKLRHSIATHLLENGANLVIIKKFLGHESINTTSIYTHLDVKHLRKEYDKFHPRSSYAKASEDKAK